MSEEDAGASEVEAEDEPEGKPGHVYVIKTTINQEENVAKMVSSKAEREGAPVYVAFQYMSSGTGAGSSEVWEVDNIELVGMIDVPDEN